MTLKRGQVVALRRNGAGMVWSIDSAGVVIVPLGGYNGPPPHRAEIRIEDPAEHIACGVSFRYPVVRCHALFRAPCGSMAGAEILGEVPAALLARIIQTVLREAQTQASESRLFMRQVAAPARMAAAA